MSFSQYLKSHLADTFDFVARTTEGVIENIDREVMTVVSDGLKQISADVTAFADHLKTWGVDHQLQLSAALRRLLPILVYDKFCFVTRFDDVQEVLARDDIFLVTYGDKMREITAGGRFFLGMQNSPEYLRDVSNMRLMAAREDIPNLVKPLVVDLSESIVAKSGGRIDIVSELTQIVPTRLVATYFGTPTSNESELIRWATQMFQYLFVPNNPPEFVAETLESAASAREWLDQTIADRKQQPLTTNDVLGRCLNMQQAGMPGFTDIEIRNNLIGLIVGAIPTTSKAATQVLDQLLNRPKQLQGARAAALAHDESLSVRYLWEALRFNPIGSGIFRLCSADYLLAKGTARETLIPSGTTVVAGIQSAMFDATVLNHPNEFRIDRPDYHSMNFGYGLHKCFGQYINQVQIPAIANALLRQKNLRRANGAAGLMQMAGIFPTSMTLEFDVSSASTESISLSDRI